MTGWEQLAAAMASRHPRGVAPIVDGYSGDALAGWLKTLPEQNAVEILGAMAVDRGTEVLQLLPVDEASSQLLAALPSQRAATMLARLPEESRSAWLAALPPRQAADLRELMAYPPGCAGALMDPAATAFPSETLVGTVVAAFPALRGRRIQDVFVLGPDDVLLGSIPLQDLVLAPPETSLGEHLTGPAVSVQATAPRDEVLALIETHRVGSLAVVNFQGQLVGVLRQDHLVQATRADAAADMLAMVGASAEERALSRPGLSIRKRLPWLLINLLTAFLASAVVGIFEDTIARFTALAVLLPVVAGQSGNTGAQAQAVALRGLALREIRLRHWLPLAVKESVVGGVNGVAVATTTAVAVFAWNRSLGLSLVIGSSMILSMMAASLAGCLIPIILTWLRQDPAAASSIILTTVTDIVGFFSFLGIATLLHTML